MTRHERLRAARSKIYRTAAEFARAAEVEEVTYRSHENGNRDFDFDTGKYYAIKLDVDPYWLWHGENSDPDRALLEKLRRLPDERRRLIEQMIRELAG
jgi:DNA-binding XRE family transcriptional regulator